MHTFAPGCLNFGEADVSDLYLPCFSFRSAFFWSTLSQISSCTHTRVYQQRVRSGTSNNVLSIHSQHARAHATWSNKQGRSCITKPRYRGQMYHRTVFPLLGARYAVYALTYYFPPIHLTAWVQVWNRIVKHWPSRHYLLMYEISTDTL